MKPQVMTVLASAATLLCVMAGGCSAHPGVALKIGEQNYSERDISAVAKDLQHFTGQDIPAGKVVSYIATAALIRDVGVKHGVMISDEAAHGRIQEIIKESNGKVTGGTAVSPQFVDLMKQDLVVQEIAQRKIDKKTLQADFEAAKNADNIVVNPKYGTIDENLAIKAGLLADVVAGQK